MSESEPIRQSLHKPRHAILHVTASNSPSQQFSIYSTGTPKPRVHTAMCAREPKPKNQVSSVHGLCLCIHLSTLKHRFHSEMSESGATVVFYAPECVYKPPITILTTYFSSPQHYHMPFDVPRYSKTYSQDYMCCVPRCTKRPCSLSHVPGAPKVKSPSMYVLGFRAWPKTKSQFCSRRIPADDMYHLIINGPLEARTIS
jgi:hypothetical protein